MQHPYNILAAEYAALWGNMQITRLAEAQAVVKRLLGTAYQANYSSLELRTGVKIVWTAAVHYRESDADFSTYLGNGQPLNKETTEVPRHRGPWRDWVAGAEDALHLDCVDRVTLWVLERALYEAELWNGFGPRDHNVHTGYLWAGTNHYARGKYVADGRWDPGYVDTQIGVAPIMKLMMDRISLDLPMATRSIGIPVQPNPVPVGVGKVPSHDMKWVQHSLNLLQVPEEPLLEDGSYGRLTRRAISAFQESHGLTDDGLVGPLTVTGLEGALIKNIPCPPPRFSLH